MVLEDRLGVTPKSMRLLLWQVSADEVGERPQHRRVPAVASGPPTARDAIRGRPLLCLLPELDHV
ncbi:hypothetical protein DKT68_06825 [Micromonospora acroterricola]|uniref:Uncharacterized protein n=1 Tax=Micromonospora acroterricola TaxID=2202421 RepID=A0A317DAN7_9ACTN|nr:hypothetical protein DKT68_06825 [Micromonospora acroterricola]